jgi:pimeloyl-ACP methyl ester carboxylesterase
MFVKPSLAFAMVGIALLVFACSGSESTGPGGEDAGAPGDDTGAGTSDAGVGDASTGRDAGGGTDAGAVEVEGTKAFFMLPLSKDPRKFFNFPFPTDLRRNSDGTLNLSGFPDPGGVVGPYVTLIGSNSKGFATQGAAYFKFDGPIDETSLPRVGDSYSPGSPVFLVNTDDSSPDRNRFTPVLFKFHPDNLDFVSKNVLAVLPESGFPLAPNARHAVVITRKVKGADGKPLGSSEAFEETKLEGPLADAEAEKARALFAPVYAFLETHGITKADVAAMTVFTTVDPYSELRRMRDWLQEDVNLPPPEPHNLRFIKKDGPYHLYEGTFTTKLFQKGSPPYSATDSGYFVSDAEGDPVPQSDQEVRFALGVPEGATPAGGWPIVQQVHGTGGDYLSHFGSGDPAGELALEGIASIGFDQPLHGDGAEGGRNTGGWDASLVTFNIQNLIAMRDNFRQSALDSAVLLRMTRTLRIPASISHTGAEIGFDPNRQYFFGHSQGGLTGPLFAAIEPNLVGAVFSAGGGRFGISVLEKTEPVNIPNLLKTLLASDDPLDLYHPVINLFQIGAEPSDPANYGPRIIRRPPGAKPIHVLMTEGTQDPYTPPHAIEALATSVGVDLSTKPYYYEVPQLTLAGRATLDPPFSMNVASEIGESATGALVMFKDQGHFPVFYDDGAKTIYRHFIKTMSETGIAEIRAP